MTQLSPVSPVHIGSTIRLYRQHRNQRQEDLAARCNISASYLSMIERGQREANVQLLSQIANALGVSIAELRGDGGGNGNGDDNGSGGDGSLSGPEEEAILAASWELFYHGTPRRAFDMVYHAIRRFERRLERQETFDRRIMSQFHQLAGVLARDLGDLPASARYAAFAVHVARDLGDIPLIASGLFRYGRTLLAQKRYAEAVAVSEEAAAMVDRCGPTLRGYLPLNLVDVLRESDPTHGGTIARQHLISAYRVWDKFGEQTDGSFTALNPAGIAHAEARLFVHTGMSLDDCRAAIEQAKSTLPTHLGRWSVQIQATEVLMYATHGEIDSAVTLALPIIDQARASRTTWGQIRNSLERLQQHSPTHPAVMNLTEAVRVAGLRWR